MMSNEKEILDFIAKMKRHIKLLQEVADAADEMAWCYVEDQEKDAQKKLRWKLNVAREAGAWEDSNDATIG